MKLQYLGDSKDSFKWDYHDFLVTELGYPILNIALMMTPDDQSNDGRSDPVLFPARKKVISFCEELRINRTIESIKDLPNRTNSNYKIILHNSGTCITKWNRNEYFTGFSSDEDQLLFLDPDNGFEPEKSCSKKHVKYSDIDTILEQISENSVVSVFQHFRRKPFVKDFVRIKERMNVGIPTAIYWHFLMFVTISKNERIINKVISANHKYAKQRQNPIKIIA